MHLTWKASWTLGALAVVVSMIPASAQEPVPAETSGQPDTDRRRPLEEILDGTPPLPAIIKLPLEGNRAVFVRGDQVILESGQVHPDTPRRATREFVERRLQEFDRLGCTPWYNSALDRAPLHQTTLSDALQQASVVVLGTVTGKLQGFHDTLPGTAVRFDIDEVLKGRVVGTERFFFFPISDFQAGPYRVCIESRSYPPLPDLGSQILVLLGEGPFIASPFWGQGATTVVTFARGQAQVPAHFKKAGPHVPSERALLRRIRAELEGSP